ADAVVIAAGARFGAPLGVPGDDLPGVLDGIDFLRRVRTGDLTALSGPVAIVGGGDVAMDCARVAKRLGATPSVIYRRTRDEMPAHRDELEGLLSEGIPVQNLLAPAAVQEGPDGHAAVLLCTPMQLGEPDASGRRRPVPVPGADPVAIPASAVIAAIGQRPDLAFATAAGVALNKKGYIDADPATGATSVPHIYAGGDAVNNGPSTLVKALADGRAIAAHLLGHPVGRSVKANAGNPVSNYAETLRKRATRVPRHEPATTPAEKRMSFDEVVLPLSREDAIAEARRCLSCDTFCSICTSVCPNHAFLTYQTLPKTLTLAAWTFENGVATPAEPVPFAIRQANQTAVLTDFCNECANCATFCPTAGRPYREKPRLYASESEFLDQADNAYRITGEGASRAIAGRLGGATHALVPTSEGYLYTSPLFTIQLSKDLAPLAAPVPAAPDASGPADLLFAATLHTLLTSIAPSQLPPVP
ncbi:MAG: FAD-dependent oxidoreductase, partial [Kiritimatiellae bacterium]|nr:FAD-dependent oxidoreductase [Kiritimatiellia bacterium]